MMVFGKRDVGQAAVLVVVTVAALFVLTLTALAAVGGQLADRVRAQTAADAVALAALSGGRPLAAHVADRHGAVIVSWRTGSSVEGDVVTVAVRVDGTTATASAAAGP
jgi:hypothetical protein